MDKADLRLIAEAMEKQSFSAGQVIFREKDPGNFLYIILTGSVRIVKGLENPMLLTILNPNDFFGEMVLFDREGRSASVEAQQDVTVLVLDGGRFLDLLSKHPRIGLALIRTFAGRLREMQQEVVNARATAEFFINKNAKA